MRHSFVLEANPLIMKQLCFGNQKNVVVINKNIKNVRRAGWREIGRKRKYFRSRWEANFARYLEYLKEIGYIKEWEYEPKTFWFEHIKRGVRSYLPDFRVSNIDGTHRWVEVKGYLDSKSMTKIKRFGRCYPEEKLVIIDKTWFAKNNSKMKIICKEWEHG